ncbi:MAG TPA: hypothetical protein VJ549_03575 [Geothrix sp.]|nr:hypothetical protein [Geothrix sp.]
MHPLLRALDFSASADETSVYEAHPILDHASAGPRGLPLLLSLGLTPLLVYALALGLHSPASRQAMREFFGEDPRSVSLLLAETASASPAPTSHPSPAPAPITSKAPSGSQEPAAASREAEPARPLQAVDPSASDPSPRAEPIRDTLSVALPRESAGGAAGGGTAGGQGQVKGEAFKAGHTAGKTFDFQLVPTRRAQASHQLIWGQESAAEEPVKVRIQVGEDGLPFEATVVSGPPFLHAESIKAALQWRFEPLALHGLKAPISTVLTFYPNLMKPR